MTLLLPLDRVKSLIIFNAHSHFDCREVHFLLRLSATRCLSLSTTPSPAFFASCQVSRYSSWVVIAQDYSHTSDRCGTNVNRPKTPTLTREMKTH